MAESIVSTLIQKLSLVIEEEAKLLLGVDKHVLSLQDELEWIKYFLKDAEKKRNIVPMVDVWVRQVRNLAYDAEDVIDAFIIQVEEHRRKNICFGAFGSGSKLKTHHEIGKNIEQINKRSKEILYNRKKYGDNQSSYNLDILQDSDQGSQDLASRRRRSTTIEEPIIVGLHEKADQLATLLMDAEEHPQRSVMAIIGIGGLGKTTLAKKIYNRDDIVSNFRIRAWIFVSQEYSVTDLLFSILKQVMGGLTDNLKKMEDADLMKEELCNYLQGKRYFIVIDDIWKSEAWDQIQTAFPENHMGSRVMLTTRNEDVALQAVPSTHHHHALRLLNKDESWELFSKKVFTVSGSCPPELVEVGRRIVDKCGGLPLAIVVLGGLMMGKERAHHAWSKVIASANWKLSQDSNPCRAILALSYTDLPFRLKPCFLYLGLFPEDHEIDVNKLISLWVAEGFVQSTRYEKMEDVAEDYLEELIQRSMLQLATRKYHGGPAKSCRVHDQLRELAISEAQKDGFLSNVGFGVGQDHFASSTRLRRLAIQINSTYRGHLKSSIPNLRSWLIFSIDQQYTWDGKFIEGIKMLRVLDLENIRLRGGLPKEIGKLILLQYLGLRNTYLKRLPTHIDNLVKLQTLDLRSNFIKSLPKGLWKMKNLRHLYLDHGDRPKFLDVTSPDIKDFGRDLLTLEVDASIWMCKGGGLSNVFATSECLRSLTLNGEVAVEKNSWKSCFMLSLTELRLEVSGSAEDPSDVLGSLPNLKILFLGVYSYKGREMVFSAERFPQLQFLVFHGFSYVENWTVENCAMPRLRHLRMLLPDKLSKLPDGLRSLTHLQIVEIAEQTRRFKDRVEENGEDWDKISHIPSVVVRNFSEFPCFLTDGAANMNRLDDVPPVKKNLQKFLDKSTNKEVDEGSTRSRTSTGTTETTDVVPPAPIGTNKRKTPSASEKAKHVASSFPFAEAQGFFEPHFLIDGDKKIPLTASLFADRPIPHLGKTIASQSILPKDKSAMSQLSQADRFDLFCDFAEKAKAVAVSIFEVEQSSVEELQKLKNFFEEQGILLTRTSSKVSTLETQVTDLTNKLNNKDEDMKKLKNDFDMTDDERKNVEDQLVQLKKGSAEIIANLQRQMNICFDTMQSLKHHVAPDIVQRLGLDSDEEDERVEDDTTAEVPSTSIPADITDPSATLDSNVIENTSKDVITHPRLAMLKTLK